MKFKADYKKVLEYLQKYGPVNTFRLSRHLKIDRAELINIIKKLTQEGLTEFKRGMVAKLENDLTEKQKPELEKEEKVSKIPIKQKAVKAKKPEKLEKEEKIDTYITRDLKKQEKQFKEREKEGERIIRTIDEEFEKLEKKPIEIKKRREIPIKPKEPKIIKKKEKDKKQIKKSEKELPIKKELEQKAILKLKKVKKKKEKIIKKAKIKKKPKKVKRKELIKEKKELDPWIAQRKLELEKLKIDIKLLSLSPNPEDVRKLRDSIAKLRNMIEQKKESG